MLPTKGNAWRSKPERWVGMRLSPKFEYKIILSLHLPLDTKKWVDIFLTSCSAAGYLWEKLLNLYCSPQCKGSSLGGVGFSTGLVHSSCKEASPVLAVMVN